ncbi:hypothetical protein LMG18090_04370 [Ralstonia mannitolilytica]|uniref:ubiquitin-activating E1 FCCH domain-containing protein n=1 Tax=Ralstonia mannitolilytica TaxID=105219 RepID=UPI0028F55B82|nr:ubiquitin-activating E1 FCCH domain-containing protein [Ralstonia mannitolilytica]CAJ0802982.1 hypothetical protein LMG18090_04370 [Ralstonia mannitolilytica]
MAQPVILPSFGAGELAPSMYGRVDLAKYHVGAARLRNYFVDYRGGASSRTGTQFVGQVKDSSTPNRLIPFQFNTQQTYALVFGNQSLRFVTNGGYVLEPTIAITGISKTNPVLITSPGHGYSNGDLVFLSGISGMTQLNQRYAVVTGAGANSYSLNDMYGVPLNTSNYGAYISGGTAARVYTLSTPYAGADLGLLKYTQSADTMTLVHPSYPPYTLKRQGNANWTLAAINFAPTTAAPTGVVATFQNRGTGTAYPNTQYGYVVTAIVRGVESLPSAIANTTSIALGQNVGAQNSITWNAVTGATLYNIYRTQENLGSNVPQGALLGYIGSTTPAGTNSFIDDNILPDFTRCPPQAYNPFTTAGNPGCVTYYQQRQVFGGMANAPEQIDFSKSGDFFNMDYSIPSKDNDNIEITIASQQVNAIKHLVPMQSLIALTSNGAWKIDAGSGAAITPTQIQATPQAYNGCSDVPPLIINYDILYVQSKGSIVRDLSYNFYVNVFTGTDISLLANHLFYGHQIMEWCYAEEPFKLIWSVREDGILLSLTYLKEQDVYAWSHHDTAGLFKSICTISEGQENAVYVIVERLINGQYLQYIERFASRQMKADPTIGLPADASLAWCVDAGLQYPLTKPAATLTPSEVSTVPVVYGVHTIAGGQNYSSGTVITVTDETGVGAVLTPVISGGVIQSVTVVQQGSNYTNPTLTIIDPAGTGSGAAVQAILASPVPMTASAGVFGSANVGDVVRINGGMGTVLQVQNSQQILVNVTTPLTNTWPAVAGSWSITTPVSTIRGLDHLNGQTVSILADGNVAPPQVVVDGSITLDRPYSAITAGLPFTCQLQSLYLDIQGADGTIQSKRKTVPAVTVRMQDTRGLKAGPTFDNLVEIKERTTEPMGQPIKLFTGDQRIVLPASYNVPGQICIQQDYPLPSTILALIPEVVVGDTR